MIPSVDMYLTLLLMVNLEIVSLKNMICQCSSSKLSCFSQADQEIQQSSTKEIFASTLSGCEESNSLSLFHLTNNQAETIIAHNLSQIFLLHLSDCNKLRLKEGMFSAAENLLYLTLVRNKISQLKQKTFLGLTDLQLLNLNNNRIRILIHDCFQDLADLRELYLKRNQISLIDSDVFKEMRRLTVLDLSNNHLSSVTEKTFHGLGSLEILLLSGNKIKQSTVLSVGLIQPEILNFPLNPWDLPSSEETDLNISNKKVVGEKTEESKTGELLSILIFLPIVVVALLALVTLLIIISRRKRKVPLSSLLVVAEEMDEKMAESLCTELRHLLPQITISSCWDSAQPGQLKVERFNTSLNK